MGQEFGLLMQELDGSLSYQIQWNADFATQR